MNQRFLTARMCAFDRGDRMPAGAIARAVRTYYLFLNSSALTLPFTIAHGHWRTNGWFALLSEAHTDYVSLFSGPTCDVFLVRIVEIARNIVRCVHVGPLDHCLRSCTHAHQDMSRVLCSRHSARLAKVCQSYDCPLQSSTTAPCKICQSYDCRLCVQIMSN